MPDFSIAAAILLDLEGGYASSDNANGAVNRGITADLLRRLGRPFDPVAVQSLTEEETLDIYYEVFWKPIRGDTLPGQEFANLMLATSVHTGVPRAVKILQRLLGVDQDGVLGPKTLAAAIEFGRTLPAVFASAVWQFYEHLAAVNPKMYLDDLPGWRGRLRRLVPDWGPAHVV